MHRMHRLIVIFSVTALAVIQPAVAQFEVSPDHFDNPANAPSPQAARAEQKLKQSIADEQAALDNYAGQLATKAQQVEDLRQEAIAAGINGDGADAFVSSFRNGEQELCSLQASLAQMMDFSREVLAGLHNDLDLLEAGTTSLSAVAQRSSKTLQASARTGR
jgi:hypothetical protein